MIRTTPLPLGTFSVREGRLVEVQLTLMASDFGWQETGRSAGRVVIEVNGGASWSDREAAAAARLCGVHHSYGVDMRGMRVAPRRTAGAHGALSVAMLASALFRHR